MRLDRLALGVGVLCGFGNGSAGSRWTRWLSCLTTAAVALSGATLEAADRLTSRFDLGLDELREKVLTRNESVLIKALEAEIGRKNYQAERGVFEPAVVGSVERIDTQRPNNLQQQANLGLYAREELLERNTLYDGGLEFLLPSGGKLRTGYTLRQLKNNIQTTIDVEYETFVGARILQPLLKNFGPSSVMARIRLAAMASEVAYQEYRRQLMLTIGQAESGYWDLHLTQEQERLSRESLATAEKILTDNQTRVSVGKAAEIEVLQAQAGAAFRRTRLNEAHQRVYETGTRLGSLFSYVAASTNALPRAVDHPALTEDPLGFAESYEQAFAMNPDFLIRRTQVEQENLRVKYTKNQRLPELDLKASYGLNGLGGSPGSSWDDIENGSHAAWTLGFEFRVPLAGGIKEKADYDAARVAKQKALLGLKEAEVQVLNSIDAAQQKVRLYRENVGSYQSVADYHQRLLEAQMERLAVGALDSKTVLETEEKLFESRVAVVESLVLCRKATLELELVRGTLLQDRDLEVTRAELKRRTQEYVSHFDLPSGAFEAFQRRAVNDVEKALAPAP
ncbi:MAG TPA: TolC family protein [Verrucomicrobiota bacterium]|nr:TolC family protein [Verrucomicrobiota bacterium]HNU50444.1 TolC family protein [Verrucomicrobiota bacterium]